MTALIVIAAGVLGLAAGSFANVPIHRWPRGGTVMHPRRSSCPLCGTVIRSVDNIPLASWLMLHGRCRACRGQIHWRYPLVEAVTGILFALVALSEGPTWLLPAVLALTWSLVVGSAIDLEHRIIPNRLTYRLPLVLLVLLLPPTFLGPGSPSDLLRGAVAAVVVPGIIELLAQGYRLVRGQRGFGLGDVKWLVSLALVCGYLGVFELVVLVYGAIVTAVVVAVPLLLAGRAKLASRIPFGPYLAVGALVAILAGEALRGPVLGYLGLG